MQAQQLNIGFVRRGYSRSGGAESYLKRLARGVAEAGHHVCLFTGAEWPQDDWPFGEIRRVRGKSARQFADHLEKTRAAGACDILMTLERVWRCDVYRAGDGVHAAWLNRRTKRAGAFRSFLRGINRKHHSALALEEALFGNAGARRVIANSQMVKQEIVDVYGYDAGRIDVVYNGVPSSLFARAREYRESTRREWNIPAETTVALFVGTGWERKGLAAAMRAVDRRENMQLVVAGRGSPARYRSKNVRFLGEVRETIPLYGAADVFVLPTLYDPFSNACLEALAAGLPVITTNANGFSEIIENGVHASIVNPGDVDAIAGALEFWSDTTRREEVFGRNTVLGARYDISANVERTLDILLQLAASAESTSG